MKLTEHFSLSEFVRPQDMAKLPADVRANLEKLARMLEGVRERLGGKAITITSGYRTVAHNKAVGGASASQHLYGRAADIVVAGMPPAEVQRLLEDWWPGGLGYGKTFTHLDIRGTRERFNY